MLLKSIDQNDSRDGKVATQSFDYYNDLKNGLFSSKAELWKAEGEDYEAFLSHSVRGCDDNLSLLGGGASKSHTTGWGTMVGIGFAAGTVNVGPSFSNSKSSNSGKVDFCDIDGDDTSKLFKRG